MNFEVAPKAVAARHLDWILSPSVVSMPFKAPVQEVGFLAKIATLPGPGYSYTHAPAPETDNRTEAWFDDTTAILKLSPDGKIELSLSFRWFSRHRGAAVNAIVPIVFELRDAANDLLTAVNFPYLGWDCSCGNDPGRALYQRQVLLQNTQAAWFTQSHHGDFVLPNPLKGDKGPVCG